MPGDHLAAQLLGLGAGGVQAGAAGQGGSSSRVLWVKMAAGACWISGTSYQIRSKQGSGLHAGQLLGQGIELAGAGQGAVGAEGELCHLGGIEGIKVVPLFILAATTARPPLVVAHLLEPKTRHRRIEQPEQPQVLVFAAASGQFDNRRGLLEHLATAIQHKVVVGGDFGEGDEVLCRQAVTRNEAEFPPIQPCLFRTLSEHQTVAKVCPKFPEMMNSA